MAFSSCGFMGDLTELFIVLEVLFTTWKASKRQWTIFFFVVLICGYFYYLFSIIWDYVGYALSIVYLLSCWKGHFNRHWSKVNSHAVPLILCGALCKKEILGLLKALSFKWTSWSCSFLHSFFDLKMLTLASLVFWIC
jgi:hypothetical protein